MKSRAWFSREKQRILSVFESFVRYRINLGIGSIIGSIYICLTASKIYPKSALCKLDIYTNLDVTLIQTRMTNATKG